MATFFSLQGRLGRGGFWLYGILALGIIEVVGTSLITRVFNSQGTGLTGIGEILEIVFALVLIWANLAVTVKRWHDRGKSGWWILITLIPVIGPIWEIIELGFLPGTDGPNQYGSGIR